MKNRKYIIYTILWMAVIFIFSSENGSTSNMNNFFIVDMLKRAGIDAVKLFPGADINFIIRKSAHVTEYFILGVLLYRSWSGYLCKGRSLASSITGFIYACTDEFHQSLIPGRSPSFRDVLIDTSGVIAAVVICTLIYHRKVQMAHPTKNR